ncbi:hypothetical protein FB451DRAFT_1295227 [Mycena latifolia]|nr:hypothetical protein FB451DRAFT_1295227 [Mycena latifolia]
MKRPAVSASGVSPRGASWVHSRSHSLPWGTRVWGVPARPLGGTSGRLRKAGPRFLHIRVSSARHLASRLGLTRQITAARTLPPSNTGTGALRSCSRECATGRLSRRADNICLGRGIRVTRRRGIRARRLGLHSPRTCATPSARAAEREWRNTEPLRALRPRPSYIAPLSAAGEIMRVGGDLRGHIPRFRRGARFTTLAGAEWAAMLNTPSALCVPALPQSASHDALEARGRRESCARGHREQRS